MLSDIGNALHDVGVATWALRWPIAAVFILAAIAVVMTRHLEQDRAVQAELDAALDQVATLQPATAVLAINSATQDSPASWINDGSHL